MERFLRGHVWIGELETRAKNWKKLLVGAFYFYFHQLNFCLAIHPYPKTATKERGEKKLVVISFLVATNFSKFKIISFLKC
jgi:hypothetical protein